MRLMVLIVIGFVVGCNSNRMYQRKDNDWLLEAREHLMDLEENYRQWEKARVMVEHSKLSDDQSDEVFLTAFGNADEEVMDSLKRSTVIAFDIQRSIFALWELTGHCAFADIPCRELVKKALVISNRYRKFIRRQSDLPYLQMLRQSLEDNVELVRTEYCWPAVFVIQRYVWFESPVIISGIPRCVKFTPQARNAAYQAMKGWLKENRRSLVWNPVLESFARYGILPFSLPDPVAETIVRKGHL